MKERLLEERQIVERKLAQRQLEQRQTEQLNERLQEEQPKQLGSLARAAGKDRHLMEGHLGSRGN